jgi:hypothetical protein
MASGCSEIHVEEYETDTIDRVLREILDPISTKPSATD